MDIIKAFGLSCIVSVILLAFNLIHLSLEDSHPGSLPERIIFFIMIPLAFLSFPSILVIGFLVYLYCLRFEEIGSKQERLHYRSILETYESASNIRQSEIKSSKDTIFFLRSEIECLKKENANLKAKFNQHQQEKIAENDPLVMSLRKSAYEHGWSSGHRSGFYDGYMDCKSDIAQGIDRTDEICEYAHPAKLD